MLKNFFNNFFPTPLFLKMPSFGLDISNDSLKFIQLISTKNGLKVNKYGEKKIPKGIVESGKIIDSPKLEKILTDLKKEQNIKSVRVSLLENQIYFFQKVLDKKNLGSIREAIELSLEENIPIPATEAIFDYEMIKETDTTLELQIAAISNNVIESYLNLFKNCALPVYSFEPEPEAIKRAIIKKDDMETCMIIDFGEKRTGVSIVSNNIVMFTSTLEIGGMMLSQMIEKNLNVPYEKAEEIKKEYGLRRNLQNKEIFFIILNGVSVLRDEIIKHQIYWDTHIDEDGNKKPPIKKVYLCGGDSNLIGLAEYFSVSMKIKVEIADVWTNILDKNKYIPEISFEQSLSFAATLGLALAEFEND